MRWTITRPRLPRIAEARPLPARCSGGRAQPTSQRNDRQVTDEEHQGRADIEEDELHGPPPSVRRVTLGPAAPGIGHPGRYRGGDLRRERTSSIREIPLQLSPGKAQTHV